jgi:hypothetical protein
MSLLILAGCGSAPAQSVKTPAGEKLQPHVPMIPFSRIDLTKLSATGPKGRVQDEGLPVVEALIAHGTASVPFLIGKLDDETKIRGPVFEFWHEVRVGDVAFVILTDFFTDPTWQQTTIPGVGYDTFLERTTDDVMSEQLLRNYIAKRGRHDITRRWREIWAQYKERVYWNETDRCFELKSAQPRTSPAKPDGPTRLPDDPVEFFAGDWNGNGEFANGKKIEAEVNFAPDLDRQWLVYRHTDRPPNRYNALGCVPNPDRGQACDLAISDSMLRGTAPDQKVLEHSNYKSANY